MIQKLINNKINKLKNNYKSVNLTQGSLKKILILIIFFL